MTVLSQTPGHVILLCLAVFCTGVHCLNDVFHVEAVGGAYMVPNLAAADNLCRSYGAKLAAHDDLVEAYQRGFHMCRCGYLSDGIVAYPMQVPKDGCGTSGINLCPSIPAAWSKRGWDAYCVMDKEISCQTNKVSLPNRVLNFTLMPGDQAIMFPELAFPADGTIVAWSYYSLRADLAVYASVWRHLGTGRYELVGRNKLPRGRAGFVEYRLDRGDEIRVREKDFIGLHYDTVIDLSTYPYTVIPLAAGPHDLCTGSGVCLDGTTETYKAYVFHRHDQQMAYKHDLVLDLWKLSESLQVRHLAPALRPIVCTNNVDDGDTVSPQPTGHTDAAPPSPASSEWHPATETATKRPQEETSIQEVKTTTTPATKPETTTLAPQEPRCHMPFEYKGTLYDTCIKFSSTRPWCATSATMENGRWKYCQKGDPIPEDLPCHFPFSYKDKLYNTCIEDWSRRAWCGVTEVYNGENWRQCRLGDMFPVEPLCHFPFEYKGRNITACIDDNSVQPWCSVVPVYDTSKDWRYCRKVELIMLHDVTVSTWRAAQEECQKFDLFLAMERDARAAYELGNESCECGWVSDGFAIQVIHTPRPGCGEGLGPGVHVCPDTENGFSPRCIVL